MRYHRVFFISALFVVRALSADEEPVASPPRDPAAAVQAMGDEAFRVREEAMRQLWSQGEKVLPLLKQAAEGNNPEVVKRAKFLINRLELDLTPETPQAVLDLVERYQRSSKEAKLPLMLELQKQKAWRQILRLFARETDKEIRDRLSERVGEMAVAAARDSLASGRKDEAIFYLKLAPDNSQGMMALAEYYRSQGKLAQELERAKSSGASAAWKLTLLRSSGNVLEAKAVARECGAQQELAILEMLDGNPLPWLESSRRGDASANLHFAYLKMAEKHWRGERLVAKDFESIQPFMRGSNEDSNRWLACGLYYLLGDQEAGDAAYNKLSPISAFAHYSQLERIPEALKVLGLDGAKPDFGGWLTKRIKQILENPADSDEVVTELSIVAGFLEQHGLYDELKVLDEPLLKLAKEDQEKFGELINLLVGDRARGLGAVSLLKRVAVAFGQQDEDKWSEYINLLFREDDTSNRLWSLMRETDAKIPAAERFNGLMALLRRGGDPQELRAAWWKRFWSLVDSLPKDRQMERLGLLVDVAYMSDDLKNGLKVADRIKTPVNDDEAVDPEDEATLGYSNVGRHLLYLTAAERWKDAADLWLDLLKQQPSRADFHANAAACLRRCGKTAEAAKHDQLAEELYLGDSLFALRIGMAYMYGGDMKRAGEWWKRCVLTGTPDANNWFSALELLRRELVRGADWKTAASVSEVLAFRGLSTGTAYPFYGHLRLRVQADFCRALNQLSKDRQGALELLNRCHQLLATDGSLADDFFPAVRRAGLVKESEEWFQKSWDSLKEVIGRYPRGANTKNTAAWLASRAGFHLDEAERLVDEALREAPEQAAYLDTKAELNFAKRDRKRAIELSRLSLENDPTDPSLRQQLDHYQNDPFPFP